MRPNVTSGTVTCFAYLGSRTRPRISYADGERAERFFPQEPGAFRGRLSFRPRVSSPVYWKSTWSKGAPSALPS